MPYKKQNCPICGKVTQSLSGFCKQHYHQRERAADISDNFVYNPAMLNSCEGFFDSVPDRTRYMESKLAPAWMESES